MNKDLRKAVMKRSKLKNIFHRVKTEKQGLLTIKKILYKFSN